jgi:hypothetical protein
MLPKAGKLKLKYCYSLSVMLLRDKNTINSIKKSPAKQQDFYQ